MKTICLLLATFATCAATAQTARTDGSVESQPSARFEKLNSLSLTGVKAYEVVKGNVTYSGIAVETFKADNPLQLINPLAPAKYGSPEDNVLRDSVPGRASAWKLFSIRF
jgi:hypothetical protein